MRYAIVLIMLCVSLPATAKSNCWCGGEPNFRSMFIYRDGSHIISTEPSNNENKKFGICSELDIARNIASEWMTSGKYYDLNHDGIVDANDQAIMMKYWYKNRRVYREHDNSITQGR
jgi:hypothetical protein